MEACLRFGVFVGVFPGVERAGNREPIGAGLSLLSWVFPCHGHEEEHASIDSQKGPRQREDRSWSWGISSLLLRQKGRAVTVLILGAKKESWTRRAEEESER